MHSRHCAAECRLDRWSSCIRSMSDLGQSAVLTARRPLPAFPHKQTFSGSVDMSQWCHEATRTEAFAPVFRAGRFPGSPKNLLRVVNGSGTKIPAATWERENVARRY